MSKKFDAMCKAREVYDCAKSAFETANTALYYARRDYDQAQGEYIESLKKPASAQETSVKQHRMAAHPHDGHRYCADCGRADGTHAVDCEF